MAMSIDCSKLCPEWPCEPRELYKGVWVVGEEVDGEIHEASLQMLTPARKIASKLNMPITGVIIGHNVRHLAETFIEYGADEVIVVDKRELATYYPTTYASVLSKLAQKYRPAVILIAATMRGRELAPYLANTLRTGITADCTDFDVDAETGDVVMIRPPFGALLLAHIKTPYRRPQIGTARPNVFPLPPREPGRRGRIIVEDVEVPQPRMRLLRSERIPLKETPLEKARVIVAGGRGVGGPDGFKLLEELASLLGGVVAGSRKAVDAGWIPHERQVGQTGKSVKPILYIAVGISGAAQHMFGVREAGVIVAINNDPEAPIFRQSDYGVVYDYREVVSNLVKLIREAKGKSATPQG